CGHLMLAYAVMDVVAGEISRPDDAVQLGERAVGAGEVGRAADQPRNDRHELLQYLLRGLPRRKLRPFACEVSLDRGYRGFDRGFDLSVDRIGERSAGGGIETLRGLCPRLVSGAMP